LRTQFTSVIRRTAVIAAAVAVVGGTAAAALAAPAGSTGIATAAAPAASAGQIVGCVKTSGGADRIMEHVFTGIANFTGCPAGTFQAGPWNVTGPAGPAGAKGATGAAGAAGPQGPSGVVSTGDTSLVSSDTNIITGGSFLASATEIGAGKVTLTPGTYLLTFNAKAAPNASGTAQIFPQFFIYDQAKNADFSGDVCNIGTGALEPLFSSGNQHDSYFSGTCQVTVTATITVHSYAFGYDSDQGASTYNLEDADLTATRLNAG
jgi:hypothetical protein